MRLYKLTDEHLKTYAGFDWSELLEQQKPAPRLKGGYSYLCGSSVYHAYTSPLVAVLMNPVHAGFENPRMLEVGGKIVVNDGTKVGCLTLRPLREIELPVVTQEQRIRFGIFSALAAYNKCTKEGGFYSYTFELKFFLREEFIPWARDWLSGKDRTKEATREVLDEPSRYPYKNFPLRAPAKCILNASLAYSSARPAAVEDYAAYAADYANHLARRQINLAQIARKAIA